LIHKVNRPAYLSLIPGAKKSDNDPGASQGGGNAYEQMAGGGSETSKNSSNADPSGESSANETKLAIVVSAEQIGMTEVVKDFLEQKNRETHNSPGLSVRYTFDAQPAKGLLLNKKVE
jgi:hypothetical protein